MINFHPKAAYLSYVEFTRYQTILEGNKFTVNSLISISINKKVELFNFLIIMETQHKCILAKKDIGNTDKLEEKL